MNTSRQRSLTRDEGHIRHKIKSFKTTQISYINNKKTTKLEVNLIIKSLSRCLSCTLYTIRMYMVISQTRHLFFFAIYGQNFRACIISQLSTPTACLRCSSPKT